MEQAGALDAERSGHVNGSVGDRDDEIHRRDLGGEVILHGATYDDAFERAIDISREEHLTFIHPFDDPDVIAGQGTIGLEILRQHGPAIDAIFVAIGGGGSKKKGGGAISQLLKLWKARDPGTASAAQNAILRDRVARAYIEQELLRAAAQRLAEAASAEFLAELGQAEDVEAAAQEHGGAWTAASWVERTDGEVPTEVLATAFRLGKPQADAVTRELVSIASGDYAVLVLSAVEAGQPDSVPREEQSLQSRQLAERASMSELTGYATEVRNEATVRIPDIILNPIF